MNRKFYCMLIDDFINDIDYYYHRNERVKNRISRRFAKAMEGGAGEVRRIVDTMSVAFDSKANYYVGQDKALDILEEKISCYFNTRHFSELGDYGESRIHELIAGFDANYLAWYAHMHWSAMRLLEARPKKG